MNEAQWKVIDDGIAFYKRVAPIIKKGFTSFYGTPLTSWRNLNGWQGIWREAEDGKAMAVFHGFEKCAGVEMRIPLQAGYVIRDVYSYEDEDVAIVDETLCLTVKENWKAVAVYLEKQ